MANGRFKLALGVAASLLMSMKLAMGTCGLFDLTANPPQNKLVDNATHFSEKMQELTKVTFHGCLELCKTTNGCMLLNYDRLSQVCMLYSTTGTVTFDSTPADWLYTEISTVTFPASPAPCDPSTCNTGEYCKTISGGLLCMHYPG